jgi:membrane protein implicated in regulation of membrane protease activity
VSWLIWTLVAVALVIGEVLTPGMFLLGPLALAAAAAAVVGAFAGGLAALIVFFAGSILSLALVRPIARRHLKLPAIARTGTAALIGRKAVVLRRVDQIDGLVRIGGEDWTARTYVDGEVFEEGTQVQVVEIRGVTALVAE